MKSLLSTFFTLFCVLATHLTTAQSWKELDSLGTALYYVGKFDEAITMFEKSKIQAEGEFGKMHENYGNTLNNLAVLYMYQNNYQKAETFYKEAIEIIEKSLGKKHPDYAQALDNLASLYKIQGNYQQAEILFKEAIEVVKEIQHPYQGLITDNLALLYIDQGKYTKAEKFSKEAILLLGKSIGKEHFRYANALNNLALAYRQQGFYAKAEPLIVQSKDIYAKNLGKEHINYGAILVNLADLYVLQGLYVKAEPTYLEAMQIISKATNKESVQYTICLNNLAMLYNKKGEYNKAESLYLEAIDIIAKRVGKKHIDYANFVNNLGGIYQLQGSYANAEKLFNESLKTTEEALGKESPNYAESLNNLGDLYKEQGFYNRAEPFYIEALEIVKKILEKQHPHHTSFTSNLADLYAKQGVFVKAAPLYSEAIKIKIAQLKSNYANLNENEKKQYLNANQIYFDNFYLFLNSILQKEPTYPNLPSLLQTALNLQTKGLLLSETSKMKKRILASGDTALISQFEGWQAVKNSISKAYNMPIVQREKQGIDIAKLENEANELERGLSLRSADFVAAFNPPTYTYQDIQQKLGENEVAIEMIRTEYKNQETNKQDTAYLALILTKTDIKPVLLKNAKAMEGELFDNYRRNINTNKEDKESYEVYWKAIAQNIPFSSGEGLGVGRIYFSPDGVYNQINLNILLNPQTEKYLLEEYDIHVVSNLKEIAEEKTTSATKTASLLGRPAYSMSKQDYEKSLTGLRGAGSESENSKLATQKTWSDLEYTEKEIKGIEKRLKKKKWKVEAILGKEALEERVKKVRNPTILHIATQFLGRLCDGRGLNKSIFGRNASIFLYF